MAKRDVWNRIDYDSRYKTQPTTVIGSTQSTGVTLEQVQALINKKLPPTQAQLFRDYAGPVKVSGGTASITIPSTAQVDDLVFLFISNGKYYPSTISYTDGWDYIDYMSAFGDTEDSRPWQQAGYNGASLAVYFKNVVTGDAGSEFSIEMVWSDSYTPQEDTDLNLVLYMVVMNSEYIYPNYYGVIGFGESYGNANDVYGTTAYPGGPVSVSTTSRNWVVFFVKATQGIVSTTPPAGVAELIDTSNVNHSLWVGYKIAEFVQDVTFSVSDPVAAYELFAAPPNPG